MYIDTKDDFICVQGNTDESSFNMGKCVCTDHTKRESEVLSLYPLLPNKMSMERDSNGVLYYVYSRYCHHFKADLGMCTA